MPPSTFRTATRSQTATRSLRLSLWRRSRECARRRKKHLRRLDGGTASREDIILASVLALADTAIERNMFPYALPPGIEHWTLWSRLSLSQFEMERLVVDWLAAMNGGSSSSSSSSSSSKNRNRNRNGSSAGGDGGATRAASYPDGARPGGRCVWHFQSVLP